MGSPSTGTFKRWRMAKSRIRRRKDSRLNSSPPPSPDARQEQAEAAHGEVRELAFPFQHSPSHRLLQRAKSEAAIDYTDTAIDGLHYALHRCPKNWSGYFAVQDEDGAEISLQTVVLVSLNDLTRRRTTTSFLKEKPRMGRQHTVLYLPLATDVDECARDFCYDHLEKLVLSWDRRSVPENYSMEELCTNQRDIILKGRPVYYLEWTHGRRMVFDDHTHMGEVLEALSKDSYVRLVFELVLETKHPQLINTLVTWNPAPDISKTVGPKDEKLPPLPSTKPVESYPVISKIALKDIFSVWARVDIPRLPADGFPWIDHGALRRFRPYPTNEPAFHHNLMQLFVHIRLRSGKRVPAQTFGHAIWIYTAPGPDGDNLHDLLEMLMHILISHGLRITSADQIMDTWVAKGPWWLYLQRGAGVRTYIDNEEVFAAIKRNLLTDLLKKYTGRLMLEVGLEDESLEEEEETGTAEDGHVPVQG